jgi:hypothetical protein
MFIITRKGEEREKKNLESSERHYIWGGEESIFPVLKVPRQCPLVLLVEVRHMIGINYFMMLEGLHYSEI